MVNFSGVLRGGGLSFLFLKLMVQSRSVALFLCLSLTHTCTHIFVAIHFLTCIQTFPILEFFNIAEILNLKAYK